MHQRPVGVTSYYGQNQQIGNNEASSEIEDRNWDHDRPWDEISHVTICHSPPCLASCSLAWLYVVDSLAYKIFDAILKHAILPNVGRQSDCDMRYFVPWPVVIPVTVYRIKYFVC